MSRRSTALIGLGATLGAAAHVSPVLALTPAGRRLFPVLTRIAGAPAVALTFDDGPDRASGAVLKTLDEWGATATFFVLGEQVERSPGMLHEMVQAGHEIGLHGYHHRHHLLLTPWQVADDLARAKTMIEDATGRQVTLFRAPHGIFSLASWLEVGRLGWHRVLWSRWGKDWLSGATSDSIVEQVGSPQGGDIILLHDSDRYGSPGRSAEMVAALPRILDRIKGNGLSARSVGSLLVS